MKARHPGGRANGLRPAYAPQEPAKKHLGLTAETPIPVSRIPRRVGHYLAPLGQQVWLEGEIQDLRWSRADDLRFSLRGDKTQLECVLWRGDAAKLRAGVHRKPPMPDPSQQSGIVDGDLVVVLGRLSLDGARVTVRFTATDIRRTGVAAAEVERERVRRALERDGLLSPTRKRRLPRVPRRIALVTSAGSAAEADVLAAARLRHPGIRMTVVPAQVQGEGAARSVVEALGRAAAVQGCDVVLLCRGGGSAADLSVFDDEALARAIMRCPVPVVTGIGHETDTTLADCVADFRALTPTAAAVAAVPMRTELEEELRRHRERLEAGMLRRLERERSRVQRASSGIAQAVTVRTERARRALDRQESQLWAAPRARITNARRVIERMKADLHARMTQMIEQRRVRRDVAAAQLAALGPAAILGRGYGIARSHTGEVLGSAALFVAGSPFILELVDGEVEALVMSASHIGTTCEHDEP